MSRLSYITQATLDGLYESILEHITRYRADDGTFEDLRQEPGWNLSLDDIKIDPTPFTELDPSGTPMVEVENSLRVWKAMYEMTRAQACEDRIWTRLSHVECLTYARHRWLKEGRSDEETAKDVSKHFFAPSLTVCRDDHAIARLWWNARIAKLLRPDDQKAALTLILKTADIRSNFIERSYTASRRELACAILRVMERNEWVTSKERNYRDFMKVVNKFGGGMVFELLPAEQIDDFMDECAAKASAA
jgi:hypothetical protein